MPWKETRVEEQRMKFIAAFLEKDAGWTVTQLCECFGVSRKTGYKWIHRYDQGGVRALEDRSRAAHRHPNETAAEVIDKLIAFRKKNGVWGPRKIVDRLRRKDPQRRWPAPSTAGEILKRYGLVRGRRRRRAAIAVPAPQLRVAQRPNEIWAVDYKGWFRTRDGQRCDPLTISDLFSRYLLQCQRVTRPTTAYTQAVFTQVFREYGLPETIRSDNGSPFASTGLGGLSRLSVQWVKLGIRLERIVPGRPDQNGCHERMHLTLKRETTCPPQRTGSAQQRCFTAFRHRFNTERPHEALNDDVPATWYQASPRPYPRRIPPMEYPGHFEVRRVRTSGEIKWANDFLYVSQALVGEPVGLEQISERHWKLFFGPIELAVLDGHTRKLLAYRRAPRRRRGRAVVENTRRPPGSWPSPPPREDRHK